MCHPAKGVYPYLSISLRRVDQMRMRFHAFLPAKKASGENAMGGGCSLILVNETTIEAGS
jgi:hypothetical protein